MRPMLQDNLSRWKGIAAAISLTLWGRIKDASPEDIKIKVRKKYESGASTIESNISTSYGLCLLYLIASIVANVFYYVIMFFPLMIINFVTKYCAVMFNILLKRSSNVKKAYVHSSALANLCNNSYSKFMNMKIEDIISAILLTGSELFNQQHPQDKSLSLTEISELLNYEEEALSVCDDDDDANNSNYEQINHRMKRYMHSYVSPRLFKATVRSSSRGRTPNLLNGYSLSSSTTTTTTTTSSSYVLPIAETKYRSMGYDSSDKLFVDSPVSYPSTPTSRSRQLRKHTDSVSSELFVARDRLRMEVLMVSGDSVSRDLASLALTRGRFASFDPTQCSEV